MKVHGGIFYFERRASAEKWATLIPGARITVYGMGYAVQFHKSGAYVGTAEPLTHRRCAWCPIKG